ncbi:Uncharacterized protein Rs2_19752 [Raphanus sativus]|nr:Uncharacterized protein Rs2_19752 [Raphanus sativus]
MVKYSEEPVTRPSFPRLDDPILGFTSRYKLSLSSLLKLVRFAIRRMVVVGRLLCFCDLGNITKNGKFMGITLMLLDEKICWCSYGRFPRVGEIEKKELSSIGDLHTYLSKSTDKTPLIYCVELRTVYSSQMDGLMCLHQQCNKCVSPNVTSVMRLSMAKTLLFYGV